MEFLEVIIRTASRFFSCHLSFWGLYTWIAPALTISDYLRDLLFYIAVGRSAET